MCANGLALSPLVRECPTEESECTSDDVLGWAVESEQARWARPRTLALLHECRSAEPRGCAGVIALPMLALIFEPSPADLTSGYANDCLLSSADYSCSLGWEVSAYELRRTQHTRSARAKHSRRGRDTVLDSGARAQRCDSSTPGRS